MTTENKKELDAGIWHIGEFFSGAYQLKAGFYQRGYRWNEEVQKLLEDIYEASQEDTKEYLLGAVTLLRSDEAQGGSDADSTAMEIVDGQQRLTTIALILVHLARKYLELAKEGLGGLDEDLISISTDNAAHLKAIVNHQDASIQTSLTFSRKSEKQAFEYYLHPTDQDRNLGNDSITKAVEKIKHFFTSECNEIAELVKFTHYLLNKTSIVSIRTSSEFSACTLYERLNHRGLALQKMDLIRNAIFLHINTDHHEECFKLFDDTIDCIATARGVKVGMPTVDNTLSGLFASYLECYVLGSDPKLPVRHIEEAKLFQVTKVTFKVMKQVEKGDIYSLVKDILSDRDVLNSYLATVSSNRQEWCHYIRSNILTPHQIKRLISLKIYHSTIFALHHQQKQNKLSHEQVQMCCHDLYSFICRIQSVGNVAANKYFPILTKFANQIATIEEMPKDDCFKKMLESTLMALKDVRDFDDQHYIDELASKNNIKDRAAKAILIDLQLSNGEGDQDINEKNLHLEHVLPQNATDSWQHFTEIQHEVSLNKLGNFCLLKDIKNMSIGNKPFAEKKENAYKKSNFQLTREIATVNDWTPEVIDSRSKKMAEEIAAVWSFDCLD